MAVATDEFGVESCWDRLTKSEQLALEPKLVNLRLDSPDRYDFARILEELIKAQSGVSLDATNLSTEQSEKFVALKNFLSLTDAIQCTAVWESIERINGIWAAGGMIEVEVTDRKVFQEALRSCGYSINKWWDRLPFISGHASDSYRQLTETSLEPALHFANDDASRPNTFWAHIDRRSVHFRSTTYAPRVIEMIDAARTHRFPSIPSEISNFVAKLAK